MATEETRKRPFVVSLGYPKYVGQEFLAEFTRDFDFGVTYAHATTWIVGIEAVTGSSSRESQRSTGDASLFH